MGSFRDCVFVVGDVMALFVVVAAVFVSSSVVTAEDISSTPPTVNASAVCPSDVSRRLHGCFSQSGILTSALKLLADSDHNPTFCGSEENRTVECLQENFDLCADNPIRIELLQLQADPQVVQMRLTAFCRNYTVLKEDDNCTNYREVSMCIGRVSIKLRNSLAAATAHFKDKLDAYCIYNDELKNCFSPSTPPTNTMTSSSSSTGVNNSECQPVYDLYDNLVKSLRFPYCDLDDLTKNLRLHGALELSEDGSAPPENDHQHHGHSHGPAEADSGMGKSSGAAAGGSSGAGSGSSPVMIFPITSSLTVLTTVLVLFVSMTF